MTPVVFTPGRNVTAFSALRVGVGMRFSWSEFSVAETVAVCVLMSSALLLTVTLSVRAPTSSVTLMLTGEPEVTRTLSVIAVLNPWSVTVTLYTPGVNAGIVKTPSLFVTALKDVPPAFATTTVAPGMTPPPLSTTVPLIEDVVVPWANAGVTAMTVRIAA